MLLQSRKAAKPQSLARQFILVMCSHTGAQWCSLLAFLVLDAATLCMNISTVLVSCYF
jgi:hypothetical protein